MAERSRAQADAARSTASTRSGAAGSSRAPRELRVDPLLDLQRTAGNQAVLTLLADPAAGPGRNGPIPVLGRVTGGRPSVQRQGGLKRHRKRPKVPAARTTGTTARKTGIAAVATSATPEDLATAEAWVRFVALRGNDTRPKAPVPGPYRGFIAAIQSAVGGPGPIPAGELTLDREAFGEARAVLRRMRADHQRLLPKAQTDAYDLADLGIERGLANFTGAPEAFGEGGASEYDQFATLLVIADAADSEIRQTRAAGYSDVPKALVDLAAAAHRQFDAAKEDLKGGNPSQQKLTTPGDELGLVFFIDEATEVINSVRARRAADMARAYEREEAALREKAERDYEELTRTLAEQRRVAFKAGDKGMLENVQEAFEKVATVIEETKAAAGLITTRVDQLNTASELLSKSGKKLIELPTLPKGLTDVAEKLTKANETLKQVIELLDLVGPAKTQLDQGLKYLKGANMALEHFAGKSANPFLSVYVGSYLSPGIKNCIAGINRIAETISKTNRAAIDIGEARFVDWRVEPGGEAAYLFLVGLFRTGGATPMSDAAWAYFDDQRGDLSAAAGDKMPRDRRRIPMWAARHRIKLWQAHYGATRPPGG